MSKLTHRSAFLVFILFIALRAPALFAQAEAGKEVEWMMTLGCRHCHFGEQTGITTCKGNCGPAASKDNNIYFLSGASVPKDFKKSGTWLVKGTMSADGKTIDVKEMTVQVPTPAELKDNPPARPAPGAMPYTGTVSHTGVGLPTLTTAEKILYALKPSKSASMSTKDALTRIGGGTLTGIITATGATYEDDSHKWIVVDSIQVADAPAKP